jgi:hypothetical protein
MVNVRTQHGAGGIFVFAALLLLLVAMGAILVFSRTSTAVQEQGQTTANLSKAAVALDQFVSSTGRLPCPANPAVDDGLAVPDAGSINCTYSDGTVPWRTIGMRRDDAFDAWGWKISYRVYSDVAGSMTQNQGASMVNCDTDTSTLGSSGVDPNKLCRSTHTTNATDFLSGKGLTVKVYNDAGGSSTSQTYSDVAYVVISHGPTGFGAYTASGARRDLPANGPEKDNTSASPSAFAVAPASDTSVSPNNNGHFDDVVAYRRIGDLVKLTGLTARNWEGLTSIGLDAATIQAALGLSSAPTPGSLGVSSMYVNDALISSTSGNISFDNVGGNDGIGINGGGSLGITPGETIQIKFDKAADKLAITLNSMGIVSFGFLSWTERAQIQFFRNGNPVATASALKGCRADGQFASFTVSPGVSFDQIQLTALSTTADPFFGTTLNSNFYLSGFATCAASATSCITPIEAADPTTHCPWP